MERLRRRPKKVVEEVEKEGGKERLERKRQRGEKS